MMISILEGLLVALVLMAGILLILLHKKLKKDSTSVQKQIEKLKSFMSQELDRKSADIENYKISLLSNITDLNKWDVYQKNMLSEVNKLKQQIAANYTLMDKRISATVQIIQDMEPKKKNG